MQAALLLDGIYLAAVVAFTGGAVSPLLFIVYVHVVAVMLLCSYRTGLKIALWHTTLFLLVVGSIDAGVIEGSATLPESAGGGVAVALAVAGLWLLTLATATAAAASERQLRRQKVDLASLSTMVARIDAGRGAEEIPSILLEELRDTFGFERGVVLASPEGDPRVLAATDQGPLDDLPAGLDPLIEGVWTNRAARLVRQIDPATDPRLAALLPELGTSWWCRCSAKVVIRWAPWPWSVEGPPRGCVGGWCRWSSSSSLMPLSHCTTRG